MLSVRCSCRFAVCEACKQMCCLCDVQADVLSVRCSADFLFLRCLADLLSVRCSADVLPVRCLVDFLSVICAGRCDICEMCCLTRKKCCNCLKIIKFSIYYIEYIVICRYINKLDWVGPVDNRPSTN